MPDEPYREADVAQTLFVQCLRRCAGEFLIRLSYASLSFIEGQHASS